MISATLAQMQSKQEFPQAWSRRCGLGLGSVSFTYGEQGHVVTSNLGKEPFKKTQISGLNEISAQISFSAAFGSQRSRFNAHLNDQFQRSEHACSEYRLKPKNTSTLFSKEPRVADIVNTKSLFRTAAITRSRDEKSMLKQEPKHREYDHDGFRNAYPANEHQNPSIPLQSGITRPKPILKHKSSPHDQHILQTFYRFHLVVFSEKERPNRNPAFLDVELGGKAAAYLNEEHVETDFTPPSFLTILDFAECVEDALVADTSRPVALRVPLQHNIVVSATFLIGAYMLINIGADPSHINALFVPFLEALGIPPAAEFSSTLHSDTCPICTAADCWRGLWKARQLGWLPIPTRTDQGAGPPDPFIADVQELVPGKLVVFRGPRALPGGAAWRDVFSGDGRPVGRDFSPAHMAGELRPLGVVVVVRLNAAEYPADAFPAEGLAFADLPVPEGGCPSPAVVAKFLRLLDAVPGAVAVHGGASLGRAGTLAALYAMRRHDFTACEAAGWLRIVRPGSISAPSQLEYLAGREIILRRVATARCDDLGNASPLTQVALMLGRGGSLPPLRPRKARAGEHAINRAGHSAQIVRIVAEVMAEVDSRMLALENPHISTTSRGHFESGTATIAGIPRVVRSASFCISSSSAMGKCGQDRSRSKRTSLSDGYSSVVDTEADYVTPRVACSTASVQQHLVQDCESEANPQVVNATVEQSLRYCADLMQLPSSD